MSLITDLAGMRGNTAGAGKSKSDDDKESSPLGKILKKIRGYKTEDAPGGGKDISGSYLSEHATGDSYHKGGKVRKTGLARLKKGERVLTAKQDQGRKKGRGKMRGKKR